MAFSSAINTSLLTTYLIRKFIPALEKDLQMQRFSTKAMIPAGEGKIGRFNVFSSTGGNVTALTEGSTTAGEITTLTTSPTNVTIAEYGEFIKLNRLQDLAAVKGTRDEIGNRLGYQAALTVDKLVRNAAKSTSQILLANGATTMDANDTLSARDVITAGLENLAGDNDAVGLRGVSGHVEGEYAAVIHPEPESDMVSEAATSTNKVVWSEIVKHVGGSMGQEKAIKGRMGSVYGTACYRSQNIDTAVLTNTITAYSNFVFAEGGMGCVALEDMDPVLYVNTPSAGDVGNPYRNHSTIAWHIYFGTSLIDAGRVVRLYSAK